MTIPDSIEPFLGWKSLQVGTDGALLSPQMLDQWPIGRRFEAECEHIDSLHWNWVEVPEDEVPLVERMLPPSFGTLPPMPPKRPRMGHTWMPQQLKVEHSVVDEQCSCGIYAVSQLEHCFCYLKPNSLLAQVAIWGKTIVAANGVRGQYAYPQKLIAPARLAEQAVLAGELYGVPVEIDDTKFTVRIEMWMPPRPTRQPSLIPLTLALFISSLVAVLALFGIGSFLMSTLSAAIVIVAIVYTKFG